MNGELTKMRQCLEEGVKSCESKEQREQRRRIELLKNWRIEIQILDRGCTVSVGCKSFAFENVDAAMETVKQYVDNPFAVIKHYGFENYL
jgi:transcription initiation factor TFIID subunit TAF12